MQSTNIPKIPEISVQIVHIEGPRKGEIDELSDAKITIGRDASCSVAFPSESRYISRQHAEIHREGNRFLLVNRGKNGSYVNGQPVEQSYLKQGDIITFAEGGPKISFLYTMQAAAKKARSDVSALLPVPGMGTNQGARPLLPTSGPFTLQFGVNICSFTQPSVSVGKQSGCDFVIADARVYDLHAELIFTDKQEYVLRDRSDAQATLLNGRVIKNDAPLKEHDVITFGEGGPQLKYLGTGRFAEVIEQEGCAEPESQGGVSDGIDGPEYSNPQASSAKRSGFFGALFRV